MTDRRVPPAWGFWGPHVCGQCGQSVVGHPIICTGAPVSYAHPPIIRITVPAIQESAPPCAGTAGKP